jgi:hypothetical protein
MVGSVRWNLAFIKLALRIDEVGLILDIGISFMAKAVHRAAFLDTTSSSWRWRGNKEEKVKRKI